MLNSEIDTMGVAAKSKADLAKNNLIKYMMRSIVAGFFIVVAVILSNVAAAVLYPTYPQFGKLLGSFLFSIAIVLIVFVGGELFTGNNMTMAVGVYNKNCTVIDMLRVWIYSYIGNAIGCLILGGIFIASQSTRELLLNYFNSFIQGKLDVAPHILFIRGVLCNFCVCLAVLVNTRMKTESGKIMVMFCVIMAFVVAGFEHCVANMGIFTIAYGLMGGLDATLLLKSFVFVTLGNIVGGAVLLALPLKIMATEK